MQLHACYLKDSAGAVELDTLNEAYVYLRQEQAKKYERDEETPLAAPAEESYVAYAVAHYYDGKAGCHYDKLAAHNVQTRLMTLQQTGGGREDADDADQDQHKCDDPDHLVALDPLEDIPDCALLGCHVYSFLTASLNCLPRSS